MPPFREFLPVQNYALAETLRSGQAFRWKLREGHWESIIAGRWVALRQLPGGIEAFTIEDPEGWQWLRDYLQLDAPFSSIVDSFPDDPHLRAALASCAGLRLLQQDPWECLASFILSSTKQIVQIEQIVHALCQAHGQSVRVPAGAAPIRTFPSAIQIAALSESDLRACKMGFRAPYLRGSATLVANGEVDIEKIRSLPIDEAREQLLRLPGVGRKIADCVLLFAGGFPEAFPIDVWITKALRQLYFPRRRPSPKRLLAFTQTYFGPYPGYAQQYLFHYMRTKKPSEPK